MNDQRINVEQLAPDGTHKARIKHINIKDNMIIFDIEIFGGIHDGGVFHFSLDRTDKVKNKMTFDTLNILANCAGLKKLCSPYNELIGTKFFITVKNTNIQRIAKLI